MPSYYYIKFQKNPCVGRNERCPLYQHRCYGGTMICSVSILQSEAEYTKVIYQFGEVGERGTYLMFHYVGLQ